ncbi:MAG: hypothetical protein QG567_1437, partial [Campylobacterota bacterium]|nr:hypothetical protein [Campylobacterota bacterium]
SSTAGAACHGVGGAKDIESVLSRNFVHPVIGSTVHTNLDTLYGTGVTKVPTGSKGIDWATSKHTVCMDCHNQHQATADKHVPNGQWYPTTGTNLVSGVLRGVPGVEPTWPSAWTQPTTFTTQLAATKEYQICMKCHSYWGLGAAVKGINTSGYVSPSDGTTPMTDLAWELSPNNKSAHPVVVAANDRTGSYAPKALVSVQMIAPWTNYGTQTMYCSDCHGSDNELAGDPRGPHGSNLKYILKGVNHYWPKKPDGVTLYTMDDLKNNTDQELFCKNCHNPDEPHTLWMNAMANKGFTCVQCHVAVPHGSPVSRLIGYGTFPAPYNYGGNSLAATGAGSGYRKDIYTDVDANDYYSTHASGGMCHPTNAGGYDANLMP